MLLTKLSTLASPPKLSVHWSFPWGDEERAASQKKRLNSNNSPWAEDEDGEFNEDATVYYTFLGKEPNWKNARAIYYKNDKIRIFPHEFSIVTPKEMQDFVDEGALELVEDPTVTQILGERSLKGKTQHDVYGAALVDGCDHWQAMMVALGEDPTGEFPPIGWWKMSEQFAGVFCYEEEMAE